LRVLYLIFLQIVNLLLLLDRSSFALSLEAKSKGRRRQGILDLR